MKFSRRGEAPPAENETQKFSGLFRSPALRAGSLWKTYLLFDFYLGEGYK